MKVHRCSCGNSCELQSFIDTSHSYPKNIYFIKCSKCGKESGNFPSSSKTMQVWNDINKSREELIK